MTKSMIYVFLANGFEEIEAISVIDVLRRAEYQVETVAVGTKDKRVIGAHNMVVEADRCEQEIHCDAAKAIVLPGGMPGTLNLEKSSVVREAIQHCEERGKWIAAICAAPSILGHMGILQGKIATCFPGFEGELTGAQISADPVCQDGTLITGKGPGAAIEFALRLVAAISGEDLANNLRMSMQCQPM